MRRTRHAGRARAGRAGRGDGRSPNAADVASLKFGRRATALGECLVIGLDERLSLRDLNQTLLPQSLRRLGARPPKGGLCFF